MALTRDQIRDLLLEAMELRITLKNAADTLNAEAAAIMDAARADVEQRKQAHAAATREERARLAEIAGLVKVEF